MWQRLSRSELLSTFFPTWIWQGREWAKGKVPKYDPYFWISAYSHPVLSTFYPPQLLGSLAFSRASLETAFKGYVGVILLHLLFGFYGWYTLLNSWASPLVSIFGAITFVFSGYNFKQQGCFQYTIAWFPWLLTGIATHNILLTGVSFGMTLLAGYYPIGIQTTLIAVGASVLWGYSLLWVPIGFAIGLPQIIPFLRYLPKTIRTKKVSSIGKVPWWHPITLLFPTTKCFNGVGYWEMAYYVGIVPLVLIFASSSRAWIICIVSYLLMIGLFSKHLPRIPARWCFSFQFAIGWMAVSGLNNLHLTERALACLIVIQAFDLIWHNASLIPTSPYSELYQRPSRAFNTPLTRYLEANLGNYRVSGLPYPLFTGHINKFKTIGYCGGMQLKLMAKWRKDNNSDGSGQHDFFKGDGDPNDLTRSRIKYAYTTAKCDWIRTEIDNLYLNPVFSR